MATNNSRRSSISNADSGISFTTSTTAVNPRYACYWSNECQGQHELDDCRRRKNELRGKLGIYYSSNAMFKRYQRDEVNDLSLEHNPTGCTMMNLLIYKKENDEISILLVLKSLKEKPQDGNGTGTTRQPLLAFPSSYPYIKNEDPRQVAVRALNTITNENEITTNVRSRLKRFLFVDASVIYPLYLTNDQANLLTDHFSPNDEVISLHWFPLSMILNQLPQWNNYLSREEDGKKLAQVRHQNFASVNLNQENLQYTIWSVTTFCLLCIRNHVGFETFLQS